MHALTLLFLLFLAAGIAVQWHLIRRHALHVRSHRHAVPEAFQGRITLEEHGKAADYTLAKCRFRLADLLVGGALLLVWTLGGALDLLDTAWRSLGAAELWTGTAFVASLILIGAILDLPLSLYRTFRLEQQFGFNRMTPRLYLTDLLKQFGLFVLIGIPMIMLVLWIMQAAGPSWWIWVWLTWLAFSLVMMWVYPAFIAPLFNRFRPLEDESLRGRIESLLRRNGFTSRGVFVMDGSARSTHGNAYFAGMGASKRIVFFDTLIGQLSHEEIEAVLAHELGHFKCHHISKRIVTMAAVMFAGLALLGWLIGQPWFYSGLGVTHPSAYMGLTLFVMVSPAFTFMLQPLFSWISRRHEFEADDFAAAQAQTGNLIQALVKLYRENANTLTPDPAYSAFHDSHPPAPIRIAHLNAKLA
jgi:STE24 endopeptidase